MISLPVLIAIVLATTPTPPGYDAFDRQDLWEAAVRNEAKYKAAKIAHDGCLDKLATRTATVIAQFVPVPASAPSSGYSLEVIILTAAIAAVLFAVVGYGLGADDDPSTVVVR